MAVQIDWLKTLAYFSGLTPTELESVGSFIFEKTAEKGELILVEGEPAGVLYFVVSGVVKVFKTSAEGKEQILYFVLPGESFNDVPVFEGGQNLAGAEATMTAILCGLRKSELATILRSYPQVAWNILEVLSQRVQRLVSLIEDLSFRQVTGRVARILLEYVRSRDDRKPRLTQQEMAAMAGTVREMVGRSLRILAEEGKIKRDRHRIIITDEKAVRQEAGLA